MDIEYDSAKRDATLRERGLDFADAWKLFDGRELTVCDDRVDYGEVRWISYGWVDETAVALVWTERENVMRVISMRRMHQWEIAHVRLD